MNCVWLNIVTGEFSNSWGENENTISELEIKLASKHNWKLIKYECVNDTEFKFSKRMRIK